MMKRIYIIDTENVKSEAYDGITALSNKDEVVLFVTKNSNNISIETAININNSKCRIRKLIGSSGTPNALDFQIISYLGVITSKKNEKDKIYIVSGDKDFDVAIRFLKNHFEKANIKLIKSIHKSLDKNDLEVKISLVKERLDGYFKESNIDKLIELCKENPEKTIEELAKTINENLYESRLKDVL